MTVCWTDKGGDSPPQAPNIVSVLGEALARLRGLSFLAGAYHFDWLKKPPGSLLLNLSALPTASEYSGVQVLNQSADRIPSSTAQRCRSASLDATTNYRALPPSHPLRSLTVFKLLTRSRGWRSLADLIPAPAASCLSLLHFSDLVEVARRSGPGNLQAIEGWPLRCRPSEKVWRQPHRHSQHRQWPQVEVVG